MPEFTDQEPVYVQVASTEAMDVDESGGAAAVQGHNESVIPGHTTIPEEEMHRQFPVLLPPAGWQHERNPHTR